MISLIGNRPALQIGRYQVIDYDTAWLGHALRRAARAADLEDFPFVADICSGIEKYLETKCPLQLLRLDDLYDKLRKMLVRIGCAHIAEKLEQLAPPMTISLVRAAMEAGSGFEESFFEMLGEELSDLQESGAEEIRFNGLRESTLILSGADDWDEHCDEILQEICRFLENWEKERPESVRQLRLYLEQ